MSFVIRMSWFVSAVNLDLAKYIHLGKEKPNPLLFFNLFKAFRKVQYNAIKVPVGKKKKTPRLRVYCPSWMLAVHFSFLFDKKHFDRL